MALPVLAHHESSYGEVLEEWHSGSEDLVALEHDHFDFDHATVASWMCDEWNFPPPLAEAVAQHHDPPTLDRAPLPLVNLVSALHEVDDGVGVERLVEGANGLYGIPKDEALALVNQSFEQAAGTAAMFAGR